VGKRGDALKIESIIASLIVASFAWIPQVIAQAPVGDFGQANNRAIQRADDAPVVYDIERPLRPRWARRRTLRLTVRPKRSSIPKSPELRIGSKGSQS